jgi:uncharacterized protein (DUF2249 family)
MSDPQPGDLEIITDIPDSELQDLLDDLKLQQDKFDFETIKQSDGLWTVKVRKKSGSGSGQPPASGGSGSTG